MLTEIRDRLITLSLKTALTSNDAPEIQDIFNTVADAPQSQIRKDCLEIITKRIWKMSII